MTVSNYSANVQGGNGGENEMAFRISRSLMVTMRKAT